MVTEIKENKNTDHLLTNKIQTLSLNCALTESLKKKTNETGLDKNRGTLKIIPKR